MTESPVGGSLEAWTPGVGKEWRRHVGWPESGPFTEESNGRESMLLLPRQPRFCHCLGQAQVASLVISRSWQGPRP